MPTYDYRCEGCGHAFEHFQSMASRRLKTCPRCKKPRLVRLVGSGAGLIFKGSGFYETDYRRAGSKPEGGEAKSSDASKKPSEAPSKAADAPKADPAGDGGS
jgi:putative FmdB family regulatory protein